MNVHKRTISEQMKTASEQNGPPEEDKIFRTTAQINRTGKDLKHQKQQNTASVTNFQTIGSMPVQSVRKSSVQRKKQSKVNRQLMSSCSNHQMTKHVNLNVPNTSTHHKMKGSILIAPNSHQGSYRDLKQSYNTKTQQVLAKNVSSTSSLVNNGHNNGLNNGR